MARTRNTNTGGESKTQKQTEQPRLTQSLTNLQIITTSLALEVAKRTSPVLIHWVITFVAMGRASGRIAKV